jgi:hypothetical protein
VLILNALGRISTDDPDVYLLLTVVGRLVSVAAGAGTVAAVCVAGTHAFGRRAGLFAAAIMALTAPFLYYAKTANVDVPYLFWFALSMVFYLRLLTGLRLADFVLFAACATCSIATKDQAYALYLLAPLVVVARLWIANRERALPHALVRALVDRRLLAAAATALVVFVVCFNLVFNTSGFIEHVRFITGPGSANYRVFEPTFDGHLQLLGLSARLTRISLGWPFFVLAIAGIVAAAITPGLRLLTVWLLAPAVAYYVGFIDVVLYNYDRFVLPICLVLALFGGFAIDLLLTARIGVRVWRLAGVAAVFLYGLLYAGTVDVLMIGDSRYDVERWIAGRVGADEVVAVSGLPDYLPRLDRFRWTDISNIDQLNAERPAYVLLNADYARAVPLETGWGMFITGLQRGEFGYHLVARFRRASPWPWLPGGHPDLVGARLETIVFSTLRNINPTIELYQRGAPSARLPR